MVAALAPVSGAPGSSAQPPRITQTVVVSAATQPVPLDSLARAVAVHHPRRDLAAALLVRRPICCGSPAALKSAPAAASAPRPISRMRGGGFGQVLVLVDGVRLNDSAVGTSQRRHPGGRSIRSSASRSSAAPARRSTARMPSTGAINIITVGAAAHARRCRRRARARARRRPRPRSRGRVTTSIAGWGTRTSGFMFDREVESGGASRARRRSRRRRRLSCLAPAECVRRQRLLRRVAVEGVDRSDPRDLRRCARRRLAAGQHARLVPDAWRPFSVGHQPAGIRREPASQPRGDGRGYAEDGIGTELDERRRRAGVARTGSGRTISAITTVSAPPRWSKCSGRSAPGRRSIPGCATTTTRRSAATSSSIATVVALTHSVRVRASAGRAFRHPDVHRALLRDPANLAQADLAPERAWGVDGGMTGARVVDGGRLAIRPPRDRRDRLGAEDASGDVADREHPEGEHPRRRDQRDAHVARRFPRAEYTWIQSAAPSLTQLSKYVADYAPHAFAGSVAVRIPSLAALGARADCKRKIDSRSYCGVDVRVSRSVGAMELFVEAANVFDVRYRKSRGWTCRPVGWPPGSGPGEGRKQRSHDSRPAHRAGNRARRARHPAVDQGARRVREARAPGHRDRRRSAHRAVRPSPAPRR